MTIKKHAKEAGRDLPEKEERPDAVPEAAAEEQAAEPAQPQHDAAADAEALKRELDTALARIEELEKQTAEIEELRADAARAKADLYNYRTRVERDREKDRVLAAEKACDALLPVLDNLDRTIGAMTDTDSPLYKGVAMVQKQFMQALTGLGLSPVDTDGKFDPKLHEAMETVDVDDDESDGSIVAVLNRGYRLGDRLLRAALVKVGRKAKK